MSDNCQRLLVVLYHIFCYLSIHFEQFIKYYNRSTDRMCYLPKAEAVFIIPTEFHNSLSAIPHSPHKPFILHLYNKAIEANRTHDRYERMHDDEKDEYDLRRTGCNSRSYDDRLRHEPEYRHHSRRPRCNEQRFGEERGIFGKYGSCIAVHFTTLQPFDRHFTIYDVRKYPSLKNEFFRILDLWNQFKSGGSLSSEYAAVSCFYQIFARLTAITLTENQKTEADGFLVKAREYLERNYANSTLSVSDAASVAGLSVRRFGELFHESFGETPGHYLTNVRMNAALELLRRSSLSVAEIAALSGYADASYFIRVFHSRTGISPAVYRKRAEKK